MIDRDALDIDPALVRKRPVATVGQAALAVALQCVRAREVAARVRVSPSEVSRWASGERRPRLTHRSALFDAYGIPVEAWTQKERRHQSRRALERKER